MFDYNLINMCNFGWILINIVDSVLFEMYNKKLEIYFVWFVIYFFLFC